MAQDNESKLPAQPAQDLVPSPLPPTNEKQCQWCKTPNAQNAKYCMQCGKLLSVKQCQWCKTPNAQNAKYCVQCGKLLQTLYDKYGPLAEKIKISLQMIVGCILALLIIGYVIYRVIYGLVTSFSPKAQFPLSDVSPLTIVGIALAISTAFELAYTLFTDGPDEAVNPMITGVAAGILLLISPNLALSNAGAVALLALVLVVLFILKEFFIDNREWIPRLISKLIPEPTSKGNETRDAPSTTFPPAKI